MPGDDGNGGDDGDGGNGGDGHAADGSDDSDRDVTGMRTTRMSVVQVMVTLKSSEDDSSDAYSGDCSRESQASKARSIRPRSFPKTPRTSPAGIASGMPEGTLVPASFLTSDLSIIGTRIF